MELTQRQGNVLRALVRAYVGQAGPVGSATLSRTLPGTLSSASIRATMVELVELGLIDQPHTSAGRLPTEAGMRLFVDELLDRRDPVDWERRLIEHELGVAPRDDSLHVASELLSQRTRQLGFAVLPRLDRVGLVHVTLVRLSTERVLAVLVSRSGVSYRRVLRDADSGDQTQLEHLASELNRRLAGHTLVELRARLEREARRLRDRAEGLLFQTLLAAVNALTREVTAQADVLLASPTPLLEQPEFHDPDRVRALFEALEAHETLIAFLDRVLAGAGASVTFGSEVDPPLLPHCAVVGAPCGDGVVGVLGPSRMDYARVVPLVDLFSKLVTEKLDS